MGAALKNSAFYHTQKVIFSFEMNLPILAKMSVHVRNFEKFCFISKDDFSFENLFKILIYSLEMNVPILAKMSAAHGRS